MSIISFINYNRHKMSMNRFRRHFMRLFGYARVSTSQQSLEIQQQKLLNAG